MNPWHRYLADPEAHLVRCATSTNPALARLLQPPEEGDDDASGGGPPPDMPPILCHCRSATQLAAVAQALQRRFYGGALRPPDDGGAGFASNGRFMCLRAAGGTGFLDDLVRLTSSRDVCGHRHQLVLHDIHKLTPTQQRQLCCVLDRSSGHCNFLMFAATLSGMHRGITSRCCCVNANGGRAGTEAMLRGLSTGGAEQVLADVRSVDPVAAVLLLAHAHEHGDLPSDALRDDVSRFMDAKGATTTAAAAAIRRLGRSIAASRTPVAWAALLLCDEAFRRGIAVPVALLPPPGAAPRLAFICMETLLWFLHEAKKKHSDGGRRATTPQSWNAPR